MTPIDADALEELLIQSQYPVEKREHLVTGFKEGFDLGYRGPCKRQDTSKNLPIRVGSKFDIWEKIMKEVKVGRYAGPFEQIPYANYIQSPIGLVPKAGGKTRLIFHLSYDFGEQNRSLNYYTPDEICKVKYRDLDYAVKTCLKLMKQYVETHEDHPVIFYSKTDMQSAFRLVPARPDQQWLLVLKAYHPISNTPFHFVDKNLPFGASISCLRFQEFSDALKHITEFLLQKKMVITNYLDDYLIVALDEQVCNHMMGTFLDMCHQIGCPIAFDKTERASEVMIFLTVLLNGRSCTLSLPMEKITKALHLLRWVIKTKKVTVNFVQQLTGTLNFLCRVIVPGQMFLRQMYGKLKLVDSHGNTLQKYHHVSLDQGFLKDCKMWEVFLSNASVQQLCRPFLDLDATTYAETLNFYSDALLSRSHGGLGAIFENRWIAAKWEEELLNQNPSIEYLKLYALFAVLKTWREHKKLCNTRIEVFCDNKTVEYWINDLTGSCKQSMKLIRLLVLDNIKYHRRIFVQHMESKSNVLADALSRLNFKRFWQYAPKNTIQYPDCIPEEIWPVTKLWFDESL